MEKITATIDNKHIETIKGTTILKAAQKAGIYIPRLCDHPDLPPLPEMKPTESIFRGKFEFQNENPNVSNHKGCQLCIVKIDENDNFSTSCCSLVEDNMIILTDSPDIQDFRQRKLMQLLSKHPHTCLTCAQREGCSREPCSTNVPVEERCCPKLGRCELQKVSEYIGIPEATSRYKPQGRPILDNEPLFIRNYELCINCTRCVRICNDIRGVNALGFVYSNGEVVVGSIAPTLKESGCKFCGACVEVCPTGALSDKDILWAERDKKLVPCRDMCPLGADIPSYIRYISEKKFDKATLIIREKTPFPAVLGRVCFHPCEEICRRSQINEPIAICALKRFAMNYDSKEWKINSKPATTTGKKVAIVGSGPTGLTVSYYLAKKSHSVTVFEASTHPGGMLRAGIPEYRLPREILQEDLDNIISLGVKIKTDMIIGEQLTLDDLKSQGYDAIFLAIGAQQAKKINIEGVENDGVLWGLDFLKKANMSQEIKLDNQVLVIGGGNVAMDVALTALRLGANEVSVFCLESREEMPAHKWEIQEAIKENIKINCSWGPKRISKTSSKLLKVELVGCTSVFDEHGTFNPSFDETITKIVETGTVIIAIGQSTDLSILGAKTLITVSPNGLIRVSKDKYETNISGIFAGGEVTTGPISVVEAIEVGRKASKVIDIYLGGKGEINEIFIETEVPNQWIGRDEDFYEKSRVKMPSLSPTDRNNFDEIELGYDENLAVKEADRCLQCDLRFHISPVLLPPEKWLDMNLKNIQVVPEIEGAFQLLNEEKQIIFIQGTPNLNQALKEQLNTNKNACYFGYDEDPMFTKRESELLQQFMQEFGRMPEGNEELDDDLF
ncbi:MAG: FAD-dependent oxidoreductase [Candidatus Hodarchaeales archaeon]|jgi:NADPH-dependent glutamate synthase beta subunit-like oxidoreductase/Pyruvate/2-oxoacid:ferredoxin oxidoreductase delta subunit